MTYTTPAAGAAAPSPGPRPATPGRPTLAERCETAMIQLVDFTGTKAQLSRPVDPDVRRDAIASRGWLSTWQEFTGDPASDPDVTLLVVFDWPTRTAGGAPVPYPTVADVLRSLLSDAATWHNADGFEAWASELGFADAIEAEALDEAEARSDYELVGQRTADLAAFLAETYEEFLWESAD